jgi:HAMP domain-containing protein
MVYCSYCATRLTKPLEVCPHCKKFIDIEEIKQFYDTGVSYASMRRRIWFKEHKRVIMPLITLILGIAAGFAALYGLLEIQLRNQQTRHELQIADLRASMNENQDSIETLKGSFEEQLAQKDSIVSLLGQQRETLSKIIYFTRIYSKNLPVSADSLDESAQAFARNTNYLIEQYDLQEERLESLGFNSTPKYNLQTIPQVLAASQ